MTQTDAKTDLAALLAAAKAALEKAYAPYSGFRVGAALRDERGRIFAGANVENAAYPEGICAETAAMAAFVLAGGREITEICVVTETQKLLTPCGGCRQRLAEFAGPDTAVHSAGPEGIRQTFTLGALLPHGFSLSKTEAKA